MNARSNSIDGFLAANGWGSAMRAPLAGDASFRRYERINAEGRRAVLMDAPPEKEDVRPFLKIAGILENAGLSAPRIHAGDEEKGLLLLEDLGDDLFARVLAREPGNEETLYLAAADVLAALSIYMQRNPSGDVPAFDRERLMSQVQVMSEWFLPLVQGPEAPRTAAQEYAGIWEHLIDTLPDLGRTLVLYDYHAENCLWLPERDGAKRVGLLDFQDAMMGSPAYDMVSYLEDARRDVAPATVMRAIDHFLAQTGLPRDEFLRAYALLGAQRNCRIVGTFARLALRDGKPHYLAFLPRVWEHLATDLTHPALAPLKRWMDSNVPAQWRGVPETGAKARVAG